MKRYVGTGPAAEELARQDAEARLQRELHQQEWSRRLAGMESARDPLNGLCERTQTLSCACLLAAGYHLHQGHEWRRRRQHA